MCLLGDIPAAKFVIGNSDEVYNYARKLVTEIGPSGHILGQGCDKPMNAEPDNVEAAFESVTGK